MKTAFSRPGFYIWLVLVLLPVHIFITVYAFNMNTAAWVEVGRIMGDAQGADPEVADRLTRLGYQFYKGVFALFGIELLALLVAVLKLRHLNSS